MHTVQSHKKYFINNFLMGALQLCDSARLLQRLVFFHCVFDENEVDSCKPKEDWP